MVSDGENPRPQTLVWTAGHRPQSSAQVSALRTRQNVGAGEGGLSPWPCPGYPGCMGRWEIAPQSTDAKKNRGSRTLRTAQFCHSRGAATRGQKISAAQLGGPARSRNFHFNSLGALLRGSAHQTACAELSVPFARSKSVRFSGLLAWLMWRGIYLSKLPGIGEKDSRTDGLG